MWPVIRYSPLRYRLVVAAGAAVFAASLVYGAAAGRIAAVAVGAASLGLVALFARGVKDKLRADGPPALTRQGDRLVGGELRRPLPVATTTFELTSDNAGSWLIVLRGDGQVVRLAAGGWKIDGERRFTRAVAERVLLELGLRRAS